MDHFLGWIAPAKSKETNSALLGRMKGISQYKFCHESTVHLSEKSSLLTEQSEDFFSHHDLNVSISGHPAWSDNKLSTIQADKGQAFALAEGFKQHGQDVLKLLTGTFSLAIIRPSKDYALIAVDRVGCDALSYSISNSSLIFSTSTALLIAHPELKAEISSQGLFNYLYFHMVPSPGSVYQNVQKLQPGEYLEFDHGQVKRGFYQTIHYCENRSTSIKQFEEKLKAELENSVLQCSNDDKPTASFLSGGLDSSTVTGVFQKLKGKQTDAFSIGFDAEGYDEIPFARASADHFGVKLHEYYVTPKDVLESLPLIASAYDEPFGNASAIPAYFCAKFAKESGFERLLAGDGGDEIFAGNARYAKQKVFELYRYAPDLIKQLLIEPLAFNIPPLRKVKSYIEQAKVPMPERMETYNFLHQTPLLEIFDGDFLAQINPQDPIDNLKSTYDRGDSDSIIKKMLFLDAKFTLADNDLRKVNRMCDLAGIEVRYPLLTDSMVDFAAQIPANELLKRFELRSFFRNALADFLPPQTLSKSKQGFGLPFGVWLSEDAQLSEFADASLKAIQQRDILNPDYIKQLINAHQTGHASYYGVMIWLLIMLEQWMESHES